MVARPLAPGDLVAGKYRIERILGEGGMGYVLGARHVAVDQPVAIKVLKSEAVATSDAVARFFREARAAVRMRGEHVAKVLDVGALDDGTPYMLMELLEGADLAQVVERAGWLPLGTAIDYVLQTCEALAEAHALGIIHRDIKPSNLFLTTGVDGSPCIKVLDFGISKATNAIDAARPDFGLTDTQTVMGSPQYMAPEQMRSSRRVDARTDIWALGTIMHELLTGQAPFVASSMPELFAMILQDPAPSLRTRRPDVPAALDAIVRRCLEKSPEARPESVLELARLLAPFGSSSSAGAAERVARVGKNVATTTDRNIAAITGGAERSPPGLLAGALVSARPQGAPAHDVAPSASELALANTAHFAAPRERDPRRRQIARLVAGAAAMLVIGGAAAAALIAVRGRDAAVARARGAASAASSTSASIDPPPPAIQAPVPPSTYAATSEPSAVTAGPASASAGLANGHAAKRPADPRPGASATATAALPRPAASAAARPGVSAGQTADPPKPATTASSRYD